jgi:hypothetical protein
MGRLRKEVEDPRILAVPRHALTPTTPTLTLILIPTLTRSCLFVLSLNLSLSCLGLAWLVLAWLGFSSLLFSSLLFSCLKSCPIRSSLFALSRGCIVSLYSSILWW